MKKITDEQLKRFSKFYYDYRNWRPPSLSKVAKFLNLKSKKSAKDWVIKLKKLTNKNV